MSPRPTRSTSSAAVASSAPPAEVLGSTTPRIWTPPLVELTPQTSYGFDLIDFARDVVGQPFDEWQEWLAIHIGELLPDGRPRFRVVLVLVARQNGKTTFCKILILYWLFVERVKLILGTSSDRSYAKRSWSDVCDMAFGNEWFRQELGPGAKRLTIGEETFITLGGSEYCFAANNRRAGRSMTVNRLLLDEIREHKNFDAWSASSNATNAVPDAQIVAASNQGDDESVVLDALRDPALEYIESGVGDPRLGVFEWSAPAGCDPEDLDSLAMANPSLGRRTDVDALLGAARRAKLAGSAELAEFRTEVLCQRVQLLNPAVDPERWKDAGTSTPLDLSEHRDQVALCVDVSIDSMHGSVAAAAAVDGKVRVELVAAWSGRNAVKELRTELPKLVAKIKPRAVGWYPAGPAAAVAADMMERKANNWPPKRVELVTLTAETTAVCMSFASLVVAGEIEHPRDPLLDLHIGAAQAHPRGDGFVFARRGSAPIDAAYSAAGAVWLARTLPPPRTPLVAL